MLFLNNWASAFSGFNNMQKLSKNLLLSSVYFSLLVSLGSAADLLVTDATIRILPPGVTNTAVYFDIQNSGETDRQLVAASTNVANSAELHAHIMDGNMMRMQRQESILVESGATVSFAPGGYHVMVFGLQQPLQEGQIVELILETAEGEKVKANATAVMPGSEKVGHQHHH